MKRDWVVRHEELLSAQGIADLMGARLVEVDPPAGVFDVGVADCAALRYSAAASLPVTPDGVTLEFEPAQGDWQAADQVVVALYVPEGAGPYAQLRIDSGSHTPGLQGNDYVRCYYRYMHQGWGRLEFPYENMLIFGIPDGWRQVTRLRLSLSGAGEGEFLVAGISIEERERAEGPRLSDEELFAALDLDWPGLEAVGRRAQEGDLEGARESLVDYYRARERPLHPFPAVPAPRADYDRREADRICEHVILNQQLGPEIDWRANPVGYLEWMHAFNRHFFMQTLVEAYLGTADARYARELDDLLSTWIKASPVPLTNNGGGDPAWETLSTACRINNPWPRAWYALNESAAFQPSTRLDMVKSFYEHAEHLIQYPTGHNWLVAESAALAAIGILFPEFERAGRWRSVGMERLEREMCYQVYPDGVQFELSPGYHRMCANLFAGVWELAVLNGYPVTRGFSQRLEAMFEYTAAITRPDGTRPSLNDAGSLDTSSEPMLQRGHELFGRPDLLFLATGGEEGEPPAGLSRAFPYGGHYVMRTGWDEDALWAIVDAGPYGAAHQHEDKLSLELYAYGTRFVVDPGIASYLDDPWTHYARSTAAHNTVLVDKRGQSRRTNLPRQRYRVEEPEEALWASSERLDCLWACYRDGYEGIDPTDLLVHGRLVLFIKPRFWVIWDLLGGQGEHEMEVLYHFAPMLVQQSAEGIVRSNRLGLPNIEFLPLGRPDEIEIDCGEQDPVQGWLAEGGKLVPAPTAIYRLQGELPLACGVVAAPFKSGVSSGLQVLPLDAEINEGGAAVLRAAIAGRDGCQFEIVFADRPCEIACGEVSVEGQGLVVQRAPAGQVSYIAGLNGRRLSLRGAPLVVHEDQKPLIEIETRVPDLYRQSTGSGEEGTVCVS